MKSTLDINDEIRLELINESHSKSIFELVNENRAYLREWLTFVDKMQSVEFAENFVNGTMQRNKEGIEYAFVIINQESLIGRVGIYKIDMQNKFGEIGYWLDEKMQGNGIITASCKKIIDFSFNDLKLNRLEIKCGIQNSKSEAIAHRLNFKKEGTIRQGELVNEKFVDLNLFSLLKEEYEDNNISTL